MTAPQWQRVRDLFEQALDRPSSQAHEWIRGQASDDPEVAAEAASLLEHHSRAGAFLSNPIADRAGDLFEEDSHFEPGAVVGPYTVVRELGRGGMGRVYLATDARLQRTVALKALLPSLTRDPANRERLRREARAAAALTHPGICTIYALEEVDDEVFIASEFVDGHSLREEISDGRRPSATMLVAAARELAEALGSAHAKGITHRDLKPENVMRTREGRLKIVDFGLAVVQHLSPEADVLPRMTVPGAIVGTPAYMAPEQLNNGTVDARTDIFSFGVLMYEYASGVHPFDGGTTLTRFARILESNPRPLRELRPDIPEHIATVIHRCVLKAPAERFASASDVIPALTTATPGESASRVTPWWRTHQIVALALYFVASALAWQIKEWQHAVADSAFVAVAVLSTIVGIFRGHLLFTERMNPPAFSAELQRAQPITLIVDVLIAAVLAFEGWQLASVRPLAGTLTIALAVGIALTRVVMEPSTTRAAFELRN